MKWHFGRMMSFVSFSLNRRHFFYENASWGNQTRLERLKALAALAQFHLPNMSIEAGKLLIISTVRGVMTRTLPRRDFLMACKSYSVHQTIAPENCRCIW